MDLLFLAVAFFATVLSGTFGTGAAVILIPLASFFMDIKSAIAILTIYFMSINITLMVVHRHFRDWKTTWRILYGAIPGVVIGAFMMVGTADIIIKRILGVVMLLFVFNNYFGLLGHIRVKGLLVGVGGFLYGFFGGIIGNGNTIKAAVLTQIGLTNERYLFVMASTAIFLNVIKTIIYSRHSLVGLDDIPLIFVLIVIGFVGTYIGKFLVGKVTPRVFRYVVLSMILIIALKLVIVP